MGEKALPPAPIACERRVGGGNAQPPKSMCA